MHLPLWLDPHTTNSFFLALWCCVAFFWALVGAEWATDSLCTLSIGMKFNPLITGLLIINLMGALPTLILVGVLSYIGNTKAALGVTMGGSWIMMFLPLALAGLKTPITARSSWMSTDLPIFILCLVIFLFACVSGSLTKIHSLLFVGITLSYLLLKYIHAQEGRYSIGSFGKNFIFGISIASTLGRLIVGLSILTISCAYLAYCIQALGSRGILPSLPLGFIAVIPLCLTEINFALVAAKKGQGELLPGRGLWIAFLIMLGSGAIMGLAHVKVNFNDLNFLPFCFLLLLLLTWALLRIKNGVIQPILGMIFTALALCTLIIWAQGFGYFTSIGLPKSFEFFQ